MSIKETKSKIFRVSSLIEFNKIKSGEFFRASPLWIKSFENDESLGFKLSVAVSKKYGNAVKRNLFKRRVKNAFHFLGKEFELPKNYIVLVGVEKDVSREITFEEIEKSLSNFLSHISTKKK